MRDRWPVFFATTVSSLAVLAISRWMFDAGETYPDYRYG